MLENFSFKKANLIVTKAIFISALMTLSALSLEDGKQEVRQRLSRSEGKTDSLTRNAPTALKSDVVIDLESLSVDRFLITDIPFEVFHHLSFQDRARFAASSRHCKWLVDGFHEHSSLQPQIEILRAMYFNLDEIKKVTRMAFMGACVGLIPSNAESGIMFVWGAFNPLPRGPQTTLGILAVVMTRAPFHMSRIGSAYKEGKNLIKKRSFAPSYVYLTLVDAGLNKALLPAYMSAVILTDFPLFMTVCVPPLFITNFSKGLEPKDSILKRISEGRPWLDMRDSQNQSRSFTIAALSAFAQLPIGVAKGTILYYAFDQMLKEGIGNLSTVMAGSGAVLSGVLTCLVNSDDFANLNLHPTMLIGLGMGSLIASPYLGFSYQAQMTSSAIASLYIGEVVNESLSIGNQLGKYILPTCKMGVRKALDLIRGRQVGA